jgi:hypothetical protein
VLGGGSYWTIQEGEGSQDIVKGNYKVEEGNRKVEEGACKVEEGTYKVKVKGRTAKGEEAIAATLVESGHY